MGTPHQGGNGVELGKLLVNVASLFVAADNRLLRHLGRDSEWLQQQLGQYGPISGDFVTKFAFETYKTPTALGHSTMVSHSPRLRYASRRFAKDSIRANKCRWFHGHPRLCLAKQTRKRFRSTQTTGKW